MKTAKDLLNDKGYAVWSIGPGESIYDAIDLMANKEVGALMVVEGTKLVGIVSERDYARKVILKGLSSKDTEIRDIMTTRVVYAQPEQTIEECMALMTEKRIRHLPILDGGQLVGVISIGDLVKSVIAEQRFTIDQLEHYITG